MSYYSLTEFIRAGELDAAVKHALQHRTEWVVAQLDYDTMSDHAVHGSDFLHRWLAALPPLERLQAADWAASQYVLALVHLEHSYGTGAQLYLEAYSAATVEIAHSFRRLAASPRAPEVQTRGSVAERLASYADRLEAMSFDPR
ncbi:MAG TPA: hypothetical protein VF635_00735 [Propionibacteriaceae bacterium]